MSASSVRRFEWSCARREVQFNDLPLLMGIVNVTPDSFSDGGLWFDRERAIAHALQLVEDGAEILDVGGESTRPGSQAVSLDDELQRVIPVIAALRSQTCALISVDTKKAEVARQALAVGADIINDVSGLTADPQMIEVCAETICGIMLMHMQGTPETMQLNPHYGDVVSDVRDFLAGRLNDLQAAGIDAKRVVIDPGIGFGKTAQHNVDLLANIAAFKSLERPVLIGHSRKRFLSKVLGRQVEERMAGTLGVTLAIAELGADIIRIHDVKETRDALLAWHAIRSGVRLNDECVTPPK